MPDGEPVAKRARAELPPSMPFVIFADGKFTVNPAARDFLRSLGDLKLAVVALAGPYRSGKSFLLERVILERDSADAGFVVGDTINACTKGLHISTKILPASNSVDGDFGVLVVDTEGLGAVDASDSHDSRNFALAMLLCSDFMYNSRGTIDQRAINELAMVANIATLIRTSGAPSAPPGSTAASATPGSTAASATPGSTAASATPGSTAASATSGGDDAADDVSAYMPAFTWVVRDFHLALQDESGRPITPDEYLDMALLPHPNAPDEKNRVRAAIAKYFRHRRCWPMPRPVADEAMLKELSRLPIQALTPEFRAQASALRATMLAHARPKRACGTASITGDMLGRLAEIYCQAINSGVAPAIKDAWTLISSDECRRASALALEAFTAQLRLHKVRTEPTPAELEALTTDELAALRQPLVVLEQAITAGFDAAAARFKQAAIGDLADEFRGQLRAELGRRADDLRGANRRVLYALVALAMRAAEQAIDGAEDLRAARQVYDAAQTRFLDAHGRDTQCHAAWTDSAARHIWLWCLAKSEAVARRCSEAEAKIAILERQEQAWSRTVRVAAEQAEQTERRAAALAEELQQARDEALAARDATEQLRVEITAHNTDIADLDSQYRQQNNTLREQLEAAVAAQNDVQSTLAGLQSQAAAAAVRADDADHRAAQLELENRRLQGAKADALKHEQTARELRQETELLRRQHLDLTKQLNQAAADSTQTLASLRAQTSETVTKLTRARHDTQQQLEQAQAAQRALRSEHDQLTAVHRTRTAELAAQLQAAHQETAALRASMAELQQQTRDEQAAQRKEHAQAIKALQKQLDDAAASARAQQRDAAAKAREDHDRLFQDKVTATARAQTAEQRVANTEKLLEEARAALSDNRKRERELNYAGRIAELEGERNTQDAHLKHKDELLAQKSIAMTEIMDHVAHLEAELRGIRQTHEKEMARLELELANAKQ